MGENVEAHVITVFLQHSRGKNKRKRWRKNPRRTRGEEKKADWACE